MAWNAYSSPSRHDRHIAGTGLPPGTRIAFVSDVHPGWRSPRARTGRLFRDVAESRPDIVVLGGDVVEPGDPSSASALGAGLDELRGLRVVAVLGNHDGRDGGVEARAILREHGVTLLSDSTAEIAGLPITGTRDGMDSPDPYEAAGAASVFGKPGVLVSHDPVTASAAVAAAPPGTWGLVLSGHVHGGQVRILGWAPVLPLGMDASWLEGGVTAGGVPTVVSNGTGTTVLPVRLGAPAEWELLTIL